MAWSGSTLHEFQTTAGRQQPCSAVSPGWQKCSNPPAGSKLFEAMAPRQQPQLQHDHVLLHGAASIADSDVGGMAASAALWNSLTQNHPNMLPHKVLAADLLCKAEAMLVDMLEPLMIRQGFSPSEHISQAVKLYRYERMQADRRDELGACLSELCATVGITLDELYQFETLAKWARDRDICFHPLGHSVYQLNAEAVAEARATITSRPEFQEVRESSLLLVRILEGWRPAPPPA